MTIALKALDGGTRRCGFDRSTRSGVGLKGSLVRAGDARLRRRRARSGTA